MESTRARGLLVFLLLVGAVAASGGGRGEAASDGADWPHWRGPQANGISAESSWEPAKLSELTFAWQAQVGSGFSGVAVVGDRLYTMGYAQGSEQVLCLDVRSGKQLWRQAYQSSLGEYPGPRVTPTVDGDRVYTLGQFGTLLCLDRASGSVIWKKDVVQDLGASKPTWGFAGSPVVWENLLLLNAGRAGMAVDKATGERVWGEPGTGGYASVVVFEAQGKTQLAILGERALYAVEPRKGAVSWSYPWVTAYDANVADPLVIGDSVFISSNYNRGCALLSMRSEGVESVWNNTTVSSHFSSFVFLDGAIFANDGDANSHRGAFVCLDPATGDTRWRQDLGVGSLLAAGGRLLLLGERGKLRVAEASTSEYREIVSADFPASVYWTAPVLSHGRLYVRNLKGDLFCVDLRR
jgi:outer membrane protein assembly factor BamB